QRQQHDEKRVRHLPKHVSAEERHDLFSDVPRMALEPAPNGTPKRRQPAGTNYDSDQSKMAEFRPFRMACFHLAQDLGRATYFLPLLQIRIT
ncbi:MAG: hypothetical protein KAX78_13280, partial [Phycisphaerae bacterium]|nr:hypothetical protein [Phycisphaerae bacterium]